jgi:hypothetical protein
MTRAALRIRVATVPSAALLLVLALLAACAGPSRQQVAQLEELKQQVAEGAGAEDRALELQRDVVRLRAKLRTVANEPFRGDANALADRVVQAGQSVGIRVERFIPEGRGTDGVGFRASAKGDPKQAVRWLSSVARWNTMLFPEEFAVSPHPTGSYLCAVGLRMATWESVPEEPRPEPTPLPEEAPPQDSTKRQIYFLQQDLARIEDARRLGQVMAKEKAALEAIAKALESDKARSFRLLEAVQQVLVAAQRSGHLEALDADQQSLETILIVPTAGSEAAFLEQLGKIKGVSGVQVAEREDVRVGTKIRVRAELAL